ncbi:HEAT repeat domain-containing protein [Alienimonas chondri]|uniref:HEAT repeat domain-containing protein n=1 Tax=Alienimonas chondri TaxID=2681879 RepID=A0ABX1VEE6_9PLAN|nr:HEAT repeat domain-containing protein [Alienimonas chondri]NNJ25411.1 hypothetical protein [Alienimonas chondri]
MTALALCLLALPPGPTIDSSPAGLFSEDRDDRIAAAEALADRGPAAREFAPRLLERIAAPETERGRTFMETGDEDVMLRAVAAMEADAVSAILAALAADDPALRAAGEAARRELIGFGDSTPEEQAVSAVLLTDLWDRVAALEAEVAAARDRHESVDDVWGGETALLSLLPRADPTGGRSEPALLGALNALRDNPAAGTERAYAVVALGELGAAATDRAVFVLTSAVRSDSDPNVRARAAQSLAAIRLEAGPERFPPPDETLDPDGEIHLTDYVLDVLLWALIDTKPYYVGTSAHLWTTEPVVSAAAEALLEFPAHADRSAAHAVRVLGVFVPPAPEKVRAYGAIAPLARLAAQHEPSAQAAAALLGERLFVERWTPDPDDEWNDGLLIDPEAVAALGPAAKRLVPRIEPLLGDPNPVRRVAGARMIAALAPDHPKLIPTLRGLIERGMPRYSTEYTEPEAKAYEVAASLGKRAAPLLPSVLATLEEGEEDELELNWFAAEAIEGLGPAGADAAPTLCRHLGGLEVTSGEAADALLAIGPAALPHVAAAARGEWSDPPPEWERNDARLWAFFLLGWSGPDAGPYAEPLLAAASDPQQARRDELLESVAELGLPERSLPVLLAAAADADPIIRAAAARWLRSFPKEFDRSRDALHALAGDEFATVRLSAAITLRALALNDPVLNRLKDDPNPAVRYAVKMPE